MGIESMSKFAAVITKAKATAVDMTVAQKGGGGEYTPPEAGPALVRLVSYIELGKHEAEWKGQKKTRAEVALVFELVGKRHPPTEIDGVKYPQRITIRESLSLNEKARFFKLFGIMNWQGKATHMAELLLQPFAATVVHREYTVGTEKRVAVDLFDRVAGSYTIRPARTPVIDQETGEETGEYRSIQVPEALSTEGLFLWDNPDMDQWASIFIAGEYEERRDASGKVVAPARSKNRWQETIKRAVNFRGSPVEQLLVARGQSIDVPAAEVYDPEAATTEYEAIEPAVKAALKPTKQAPVVSDDDALAGVA